MDLEDTIIITDENGVEKEFTILFTFTSDEYNKSYVLYYDENEDEPNVNCMAYDEEGNLEEVTTIDEWDMIEEMFNTFMADDDEEEIEEE